MTTAASCGFRGSAEACVSQRVGPVQTDALAAGSSHASTPPEVTVSPPYADVLSCMAAHELSGPVLGVVWDRISYGLEEAILGGEFLRITRNSIHRLGHLRTFHLPGGQKAIAEPRRTALGLLYEIFGQKVFRLKTLPSVQAFSAKELKALKATLAEMLDAPVTASAGRLFDAVASIIGLRQKVRFEGQASMDLEFAADDIETNEAYPLPIVEPKTPKSKPAGGAPHSELILDWSLMIQRIVAEISEGVPAWEISAKFHNALAEGIVAMAHRAGESRIVLAGECFHNKYLAERTLRRLVSEGFHVVHSQTGLSQEGDPSLRQLRAGGPEHTWPKQATGTGLNSK